MEQLLPQLLSKAPELVALLGLAYFFLKYMEQMQTRQEKRDELLQARQEKRDERSQQSAERMGDACHEFQKESAAGVSAVIARTAEALDRVERAHRRPPANKGDQS